MWPATVLAIEGVQCDYAIVLRLGREQLWVLLLEMHFWPLQCNMNTSPAKYETRHKDLQLHVIHSIGNNSHIVYTIPLN